MALNQVGLLAYSQGFALSRDEYIIRELALCDWTGHHHVLFKYLLPHGVSYDQLSEKAKRRVDRQTRTVHGLPFEPSTAYNRHEFHPYRQIQDDLTRWCQRYLTPQRNRVGVFTLNGLYRPNKRLRVGNGKPPCCTRTMNRIPYGRGHPYITLITVNFFDRPCH